LTPATSVRVRKGQHVVALPASVARHLVIAKGTRVFWGTPRTGQALLSVKPTAARGPERREVTCPSCVGYRKEIEKLRAQLAARPQHVLNEGVAQGWAQAIRHAGLGPVWASRIEARLVEIADAVAQLPGARHRSRARRAKVDVIPTPVLSPPVEVIDEGDAASGAQRVP